MKKILSLVAVPAIVTAFVLTSGIPAYSASIQHIKIDGVPGESTDQAHQGWIEIESLNWGGPNRSRLSRAQTSQPRIGSSGSLTITKWNDSSSAYLFRYCNSGEHIPKMSVSGTSGQKKERYMVYELTDVIVSSCSTGGSGGEAVPTEEVTFNYAKIRHDYKPTDTRDKDNKKDKYNLKEEEKG